MNGDLPPPPIAEKRRRRIVHHDHERTDDYFWLRDDERSDADVLRYLEDENAYADALLAPIADFRQQVLTELRSRIKEDDESVPYPMGNYIYNVRFEQDREYAIHVRWPRKSKEVAEKSDNVGQDEVLLDENERAKDHSYYALTGLRLSPSESLVAIGEDTVSRRICSIRLLDLASREWLEDVLEGTTGSAAWSADSRHLFYIKRHPMTLRPYQVWRHALGTTQGADSLIYEEADEEFLVSISPSRSKRYIIITSRQTTSSEVYLIDCDAHEASPRLIVPRERDHEYTVEHAGDRFYIRTNRDAPNFKLVEASEQALGDPDAWIDKIAHRSDVLFIGATLFKSAIASLERRDVNTRLVLYPIDEGAPKPIEFDEEVYVASMGINREWDSNTIRIGYQSPTTPPTVIDYDLPTGARVVRKQDEIPGGFRSEDYLVKRRYVKSRDGEQIPLSIVFHRNLDRTKPNPLYLYGYGAYGSSMDPWFSRNRLTLLDRGFVYVIAHIRGGQERARRWYDEGKLLNKMNSFTDFIDCAEYLIEEGWTEPSQLVAAGGSAGGLLVGAAVNMRPDLFRMIVAVVPFVDVVTTMLDESIPLTTFEYDEWGNPNDATYYEYMLRYSPYDNVREQAYPDIFVRTGFHDSQVQYWEPAKWVAKLRAHQRGEGLILFKTNMEAGHGGASGRFSALEELAMEYAWILHRLGKTEKIA